MPGFKLSRVATKTGTAQAYEPVVLTVALTPQQAELVGAATGHYASTIELTASELKVVLAPGMELDKFW
jgi:cell division protein FtsI/penicillin-binding protein 2